MSAYQTQLRHAVIEFYRQELHNRYQLDNVRRFQTFKPLSDADIERLRDYFLERIYPGTEIRDRQDHAFEEMGAVLRSPARIGPLMGAALKSLWRMGPLFPKAISTGLSVLDAYRETRKLESFLMRNARKHNLTIEDTQDHQQMILLMAKVPERDVKRLIHDVTGLFQALSSVRLLSTSVDMLAAFADIMETKPDLYTADEIFGIRLARDAISGGLDLVAKLNNRQFKAVVEGVQEVEYDWYERICEQAAAA